MNENNYYELALIINKKLYEENHITYYTYIQTENNLLKEMKKNEY